MTDSTKHITPGLELTHENVSLHENYLRDAGHCGTADFLRLLWNAVTEERSRATGAERAMAVVVSSALEIVRKSALDAAERSERP